MNAPREQKSEHHLQSGPVVLRFERLADRWAHKIFWETAASTLLLLDSIEGSAEQAWPASPAIQEIHFETHGKTKVAMGVGMSGTSHWSLCVAADIDLQQLRFEVACRTKQPPQYLGSGYRDNSMFDAGSVLKLDATLGTLVRNACTQDPDKTSREVSFPADVPIVRFQPSSEPYPSQATHRWNYSITAGHPDFQR